MTALVGGGVLLRTARLLPEHHVVSAEPLISATDLASSDSFETPAEDFYIRNHFALPLAQQISVLQIEGAVQNPVRVSAEQLRTLRPIESEAVLECAGNVVGIEGQVGNGRWGGWLLRDVLALARPNPGAAYLQLFGKDGYVRSVPMERAINDGMLVTHLNGRPLTRYHGTPWRARFLGWYGMDSVKWLERIKVSSQPLFSTGREYIALSRSLTGVLEEPLPRIAVKSIITLPQDGALVHPGKLEVRGLAWSGEGPITRVEINSDGGQIWNGAVLDVRSNSQYSWVLWHGKLELTARGPVRIVCRAKDKKGNIQPPDRDPSRLDGYVENQYHSIRCVIA